MRIRNVGMAVLAAVLAALVAVGAAGAASDEKGGGAEEEFAPLATQTMTSGGSGITSITINDLLENEVAYRGVSQTYPAESGTHVAVGGATYGTANTDVTPVRQSAVTGRGTKERPYRVVTVADAGTTGLRIVQTDTFVKGSPSYRTSIKVSNTGATVQTAILYRYVDCEVGVPEQGLVDDGFDDGGFGRLFARTGAPACVEALSETERGDNLMGIRPISGGSDYQVGVRRTGAEAFDGVIEKVERQLPFDNTVDEPYQVDNALGVSWNIVVPAGGSVTRTSIVSFSAAALKG